MKCDTNAWMCFLWVGPLHCPYGRRALPTLPNMCCAPSGHHTSSPTATAAGAQSPFKRKKGENRSIQLKEWEYNSGMYGGQKCIFPIGWQSSMHQDVTQHVHVACHVDWGLFFAWKEKFEDMFGIFQSWGIWGMKVILKGNFEDQNGYYPLENC